MIALPLLLYNQSVTHGSVFRPILFTMHIKPLSAIIESHSIIRHSFADDMQIQMSAPPDEISELLHSMQSCIYDVKAWAAANMLKLNDNETEFMLVTSKKVGISITYLLNHNRQCSNCLQAASEEFGSYIRLSSYCECTCLQYCSDMLL